MMLKVKGLLSTSVYADCPKCEESMDLFDIDYLNDEGQLWNVIKRDRWTCDKDGWKNIDMEFQCPKCKVELTFDSLEY